MNDLHQAVIARWEAVMTSREAILEAFIAETGLKPSECEQVSRTEADGTIVWFVRRRQND